MSRTQEAGWPKPLPDEQRSHLPEMIGELSAASCAALLAKHGLQTHDDASGAEATLPQLREWVAAAHLAGRIDLDPIVLAWLHEQGWQEIEFDGD
jgi:hypothetical protein